MRKIEVSEEVMEWLEGHLVRFRETAAYAAANGTKYEHPETVDEIANGYLRSLIPLDEQPDDDLPF